MFTIYQTETGPFLEDCLLLLFPSVKRNEHQPTNQPTNQLRWSPTNFKADLIPRVQKTAPPHEGQELSQRHSHFRFVIQGLEDWLVVLHQPLWKICDRQNWVHLPQGSGWKLQKIFELPPPIRVLASWLSNDSWPWCLWVHEIPSKIEWDQIPTDP